MFIKATLLLSIISTINSMAHFYIVAHADDWQLFINPWPLKSVKSPQTEKLVFIYLTGGDAGLGFNPYDSSKTTPFVVARQNAAIRAAGSLFEIIGNEQLNVEREMTNIQDCEIFQTKQYEGKLVSYFLRLPDGNGVNHGEGYEGTGMVSLRKLFQGEISQISNIQKTSIYTRDKLKKVLETIIRTESGSIKEVNAYFIETNDQLNPGDHTDHHHTGLFVQQTIRGMIPCVNMHKFLSYCISGKPQNLEGEQLGQKWQVWKVTNDALVENEAPSTWEQDHNNYVPRTYFTTFEQGNGNCQFQGENFEGEIVKSDGDGEWDIQN